jgi:hypothetical protein
MVKLKTNLALHDSSEVHALVEVLSSAFPQATLHTSRSEGVYRLHLDIVTHATRAQKALLLDVLRTLDPLLVETKFIHGRLGDYQLKGYMGPNKRQKEKSRSRMEQIRSEIQHLLPEHRSALRSMLHNG